MAGGQGVDISLHLDKNWSIRVPFSAPATDKHTTASGATTARPKKKQKLNANAVTGWVVPLVFFCV